MAAHHVESSPIAIDADPGEKRGRDAALAVPRRSLQDGSQSVARDFRVENGLPAQVRAPELASKPLAANGTRKAQERLKIVSLFSGCGGMDLGFTGGFEFLGRRYDALPFQVVWANDIKPAACRTYRRNLGAVIHEGDVWKLLETMPESADIIVGGFPCQDISVNGNGAGVDGARSGLYKAMVEAIRRVRPRAFVAENVAGLLHRNNEDSYRRVLTDFLALGYHVHHQIYRAADYGVPQTRERIMFVGTSLRMKAFVPPSPERTKDAWITARQALADLEELPEDRSFNHIWSLAEVSPEQGNRRLQPDRPGYTIRAECHGNIQWHYRLPRRISMREAARIQSFPDRFIFEAGLREIERQVGNAVPPVLAWHIAKALLACFRPAKASEKADGLRLGGVAPPA